MEGIDDALEHGVDNDLGVLFRQIGYPGYFLDELRLRHAAIGHW
jgi:hypothetical protein